MEDKKKEKEKAKPLIIERPSTEFDLADILRDGENKLRFASVIQPVVNYSTLDDQIVGNRINTDDKVYVQTNALTSTSPVGFTVPTGETWEIVEFITFLDTDANAANRVYGLTITGPAISTLALDLMSVSTITITANQVGGFFLNVGNSPELWTNTNGTFGTASENPLPVTIGAGGVIQAAYTNDQVGDVCEALVRYKKVVPESED